MNFLKTLIGYIKWHYGRALMTTFSLWKNILFFLFGYFSIKYFFMNFITPWKKLSSDKKIITNILIVIMVILEIIIKTIVVIIGLISCLIFIAFLPTTLLVWLLLPILVAFFILSGLILLIFS